MNGRAAPPAATQVSLADLALAELTLGVHDEGTVEEVAERILQCAVSAFQCRHAALAVVRGGGALESFYATDQVIAGLGELQQSLGSGPDFDIVSGRLGVLITDMRTETRWPRWAALGAQQGVRSMVGIRLYTANRVVGTLSLYDPAPKRFDVDDQAVAHVLARHAAVALSRAHTTANLWHAIDARKLVGQAQGILMERFDLDADQAFRVLLRYSQTRNMKLRSVAEQLIATRRLPE